MERNFARREISLLVKLRKFILSNGARAEPNPTSPIPNSPRWGTKCASRDSLASRLGLFRNATLRNVALCAGSWNSRLPGRHMHDSHVSAFPASFRRILLCPLSPSLPSLPSLFSPSSPLQFHTSRCTSLFICLLFPRSLFCNACIYIKLNVRITRTNVKSGEIYRTWNILPWKILYVLFSHIFCNLVFSSDLFFFFINDDDIRLDDDAIATSCLHEYRKFPKEASKMTLSLCRIRFRYRHRL